MTIPQLCLLELHFRAIKKIGELPHYHGAQWRAMFNHLFRDLLAGAQMADARIWVIPIEHGVNSYLAGDPIHVGLTFPREHAKAITAALNDADRIYEAADYTHQKREGNSRTKGGHFQPGVTLRYEGAKCRISGQSLGDSEGSYLSEEHIADEVKLLTSLSDLTLNLYTPMRIERSAGVTGHNHCDESFFFGEKALNPSPLNRLIGVMRFKTAMPIDISALSISGGAVSWLDVPYGNAEEKQTQKKYNKKSSQNSAENERTTLGGIVGCLKISGILSLELARLLVVGQYMGIGSNPVFGFGFYTIPELDRVRRINNLTRGKSILERAVDTSHLTHVLSRMTSSSPGPNCITIDDIRRAGTGCLEKIRCHALEGTLAGKIGRWRLPKSGGTYREIFVQNSDERLVHRALSEFLSIDIDKLLSDSSYAYRRGLSHKSAAKELEKLKKAGYVSGIKTDIAAFYDSVDMRQLDALLDGFFPDEPAIGLIRSWLKNSAEAGARGLPQGGILSPVLSNLYLDRFDRAMDSEGFRLVRYSDDFVALFRDDMTYDEGKERVVAALTRLGLELKEDKTLALIPDTPVQFLGFLVGADGIGDPEAKFKEVDGDWSPVFREQWQTGQPVYLSTICRGAFSTGPQLVIRHADDSKTTIPWSQVNRLVVVGRSPFSGGVIYRAMREEIPVTFIDIKGRTTGHLHAAPYQPPELGDIQRECSRDEAFCLTFARAIISAKINNSRIILRRNDRTGRRKELISLADSAACAENFDSLRGYEGAAARIYFEEFRTLVKRFTFVGRVYHPPDGPVNAMLSLGYSLLYNRIAAVLRDKGFNPRLGLFHQGRGTHMALASDLQEEMRHIADRVVLALIHIDEVTPESFAVGTNGQLSAKIEGDAFRSFIRRYEMIMASEFTVDNVGKMSYNAYLDEMAGRLKRAMQLGIPYQPLRIR